MGCVPVAEAPVDIGGRRPGPPVFGPAQRAQRPAESRLATCRRGAAARSADLWPVLPVEAGIAERGEAKPHTPTSRLLLSRPQGVFAADSASVELSLTDCRTRSQRRYGPIPKPQTVWLIVADSTYVVPRCEANRREDYP